MKYKRIKFPDGQISAEIEDWGNWNGIIKERINSYEDLMFVKSLAEILSFSGAIGGASLFIPCLFGQRSDRRFDRNKSFDLNVITDVINSCNFSSVSIFDPHSNVALALINKSMRVEPDDYVKQAIDRIDRSDLVLLSPDAGAYTKVFNLGEKFGLSVMGAMKHRTSKGEVSINFTGDVKDKTFLIVDDLCDGGATFIALGEKLKAQGAERVYLYVSHGLFSKGFSALEQTIDHIFCTNSVKDTQMMGFDMHPYVTQYKII